MGSELKVRVGINHAGFATGLKSMESMVSKFAGKAAGALGAAIGVHALYESAKGGVELADRLDDLSKRFDISATKLQMLGNVAGQEGAGLEEVAQSLKFLGKNAQDAASGGSTELLDIFTNLGLTIQDLKTLKADEIFLRVADAFNSGKYAGQELVILSKLLGRGFEQLAPLIRMSREELEKMGKSKGTFASDEHIKQLAQVADFMEKIANLRDIMAAEVTLGFMKSFKEFLSAGESGSVAEKLKKMLFPDTTEKGKNPIDTKQQLAVREAADKAFAESEKSAAKHELRLIDAQVQGKEEAEKMKQAIEEKYRQRSLDREIEMEKKKNDQKLRLQDLLAKEGGPQAEIGLLESRAQDAAKAFSDMPSTDTATALAEARGALKDALVQQISDQSPNAPEGFASVEAQGMIASKGLGADLSGFAEKSEQFRPLENLPAMSNQLIAASKTLEQILEEIRKGDGSVFR
jgi:hypothetical protein